MLTITGNTSSRTSNLMFAALKSVQIPEDSLQLDTTGYTMSNRCTVASGLAQMDAKKISKPKQR